MKIISYFCDQANDGEKGIEKLHWMRCSETERK